MQGFLEYVLDVVLYFFRCGWIFFHLFLLAIYRLEYKRETSLPLFNARVQGHYQVYSKIGQDWTGHATRLRTSWSVFRDISAVFLSITAPYMGATKETASPVTFALGSLCIFYSLVGSVISHVYIANGENLHKPVVTDFWLKASDDRCNSGLWLWTTMSLPAVWLTASIISFLAFIISAVWGVPYTTTNHLVVYHALMLSGMVLATAHAIMITITWLKIKDRSGLVL